MLRLVSRVVAYALGGAVFLVGLMAFGCAQLVTQ